MAQTMRRRRVRPQRALAWMLVVATLAICLAATGRVRAPRLARIVKRDGEEGEVRSTLSGHD